MSTYERNKKYIVWHFAYYDCRFFMVSPDSSMFGYGELALFIAGVVFGIKGLKMDE